MDVHVFFDSFYEGNYLGQAWGSKFKSIFGDQSDLVVCILDENHLRKIWPTFERDCFTPRVSSGEVIPIFLDDFNISCNLNDIVRIDFKWNPDDPEWKRRATDAIVIKLIDRL